MVFRSNNSHSLYLTVFEDQELGSGLAGGSGPQEVTFSVRWDCRHLKAWPGLEEASACGLDSITWWLDSECEHWETDIWAEAPFPLWPGLKPHSATVSSSEESHWAPSPPSKVEGSRRCLLKKGVSKALWTYFKTTTPSIGFERFSFFKWVLRT